ncbi:MAG: Na/Pi cotransporter family protein [Deltaproteobacteria bacterium]|nr:Na/Pi cotransporter family protein [Deltaproteobacteria bacterium]
MPEFSLAQLLGGLAFFSFGLHSAREGLQLLAGERLRRLINRLAGNRFKSFGLGVAMTLVLQSSGATTAMLVSFAGTQLLTLRQAFGVILGADVGTTVVIFLLAAKKFTEYALYAMVVGFVCYLSARRRKVRYFGSVLFGFGLVFYGIHLLVATVEPVRDHPVTMAAFGFLVNEPFLGFVLATLLTALAHSSAATIGLAMSLAFAGVLSLEGAVPIVLGANVGTCVTSLRASIGTDVDARRVAVAHLVTKVAGVMLVFPFLAPVVEFVRNLCAHFHPLVAPVAGHAGLEIAMIHLIFNVGLAVLFLPFLPVGVWIVTQLVPEPELVAQPFGPRYLDPKALDTPALAFAQAKREILRLANIAQELFRSALRLFERDGDFVGIMEEAERRDDKIDTLEKATRFYLAEISQESLTEEQGRIQMALLGVAADLEEIGDTVSKEFVRLGRKRYETQRIFSDIGWQEIIRFHHQVDDLFNLTIAHLTSPTPALAQEIETHKAAVYDSETMFRQAHLQRLHEGLRESVETSSLHLDVLNNLRRIGSKLAHISQLAAEVR